MSGKGAHANPNKGKNGSRRAAFHPTKKDNFNAPTEDATERFVLAPTRLSNPNRSAPTGKAASASASSTPAWQQHGNFALTKAMTVPQMREFHFRLIGAEPEAQIGKAKLRQILCRSWVPVIQDSELEGVRGA